MSYPVWWEDTITVYNKYTDPLTSITTWFPTVLTNCFWKYERSRVTIGQTVVESCRTICRIPQNQKFMSKSEWMAQPSDVKPQYFTFSEGDIIVKGEVDEAIDEYSAGHRSSDFIAKYKALSECIKVETIAINTKTGTNDKHYLVSGN